MDSMPQHPADRAAFVLGAGAPFAAAGYSAGAIAAAYGAPPLAGMMAGTLAAMIAGGGGWWLMRRVAARPALPAFTPVAFDAAVAAGVVGALEELRAAVLDGTGGRQANADATPDELALSLDLAVRIESDGALLLDCPTWDGDTLLIDPDGALLLDCPVGGSRAGSGGDRVVQLFGGEDRAPAVLGTRIDRFLAEPPARRLDDGGAAASAALGAALAELRRAIQR